jgi:hypothetical protein
VSIWFFGRKRNGRRSIYLIGFPWYSLLMLLPLLVVVLMTSVRGCAGP